MAADSSHYQLLHAAKMETVHKLTELNARHIRSQGRLAGIEIETAHCDEAIELGSNVQEFQAEKAKLEAEYQQIMRSRELIDTERDALELRLQALDDQLIASATGQE